MTEKANIAKIAWAFLLRITRCVMNDLIFQDINLIYFFEFLFYMYYVWWSLYFHTSWYFTKFEPFVILYTKFVIHEKICYHPHIAKSTDIAKSAQNRRILKIMFIWFIFRMFVFKSLQYTSEKNILKISLTI